MTTIYAQRNQYKVVLEIDPKLQTDPSLLDRIYVGAGLRVVPAEYIPTIPVEEGRHPVIRDAVHANWSILKLLHHRAELAEVLLGWILEIDRDVRVGHP